MINELQRYRFILHFCSFVLFSFSTSFFYSFFSQYSYYYGDWWLSLTFEQFNGHFNSLFVSTTDRWPLGWTTNERKSVEKKSKREKKTLKIQILTYTMLLFVEIYFLLLLLSPQWFHFALSFAEKNDMFMLKLRSTTFKKSKQILLL